MQERREQLAERLRTAEEARDLLSELERRLKREDGPERERLLSRLDQLAQLLPEADRIRWFTFATALFVKGEHPKVVQSLLGYSSITQTMDTYSHVMEGMAGDAVDKLDEAFGNPPHTATRGLSCRLRRAPLLSLQLRINSN